MPKDFESGRMNDDSQRRMRVPGLSFVVRSALDIFDVGSASATQEIMAEHKSASDAANRAFEARLAEICQVEAIQPPVQE